MSLDFVHPTEELLEEYCFRRVPEPALSVLEEHLLVCEACQTEVAGLDAYIAQLKSALGSGVLADGMPSKTSPSKRGSKVKARAVVQPWLDLPIRPLYPRLIGMGIVAAGLLLAGIWGWQALPSRQLQMASVSPVVVELRALRGGVEADPVSIGDKAPAIETMAKGTTAKETTAKETMAKETTAKETTAKETTGRNRGRAGKPLELRVDRTTLGDLGEPRIQLVDASGGEVWSGKLQVEAKYLSAHLHSVLQAGGYWVRLYSGNGELVREFALQLD